MTTLLTRTEAARRITEATGFEVDEGMLRRYWEPAGLVRLPYEGIAARYDALALHQAIYVATLRREGFSLHALKRRMRMQEGGESGGTSGGETVAIQMTAYDQLREAAREIQRDSVARKMTVIPDGDALRMAAEKDPELYKKYCDEAASRGYNPGLHRRALSEQPGTTADGPVVQEVRRLREEKMAKDPKLTIEAADRAVFAEQPHLYHQVRVESTRKAVHREKE